MEAIVEKSCGLDVHRSSIVACVVIGQANGRSRKESRTFGTTRMELIKLREWLLGEGVTHVGMEATGVYWKPVYAVLDGAFELIVGNAHHIKNVPGRKTDMKDAEWIATLVRFGLIRRSFVPPKALRELRELLRYRHKVVQGRTAERNRLLKHLETAGVKLAGVATDVFGVSGILILHAVVEGTQSPQQMAQLAKGALRRKIPQLQTALDVSVEEPHRFLLGLQLRRLAQLDRDVDELDVRIDHVSEPYSKALALLTQIPGVDRIVAASLIAELGTDMSVFQSMHHLAAWAGLCPGNYQSAGKASSGRIRKGNVYLKTILVEAALAASRTRGTYFKDKFHRLKARRGHKRAAVALAHKILLAAYKMLQTGMDYRELGDSYLDHLDRGRVAHNLVRRLKRLGYEVHIEPQAA